MLRFLLFLLFLGFTSCTKADTPNAKEASPELETMIAQMLIIGFRGFEVTETDWIVQDIRDRNIGGIILFDYDVPSRAPERNVKSPEQVRNLVSQLKSFSTYPLMVSIDQEGGRVNRLKERFGFPAFVSHAAIGQRNDTTFTRQQADKIATTLLDLGINVNFAPVVDVNTNPQNPVIGRIERSFSADPNDVITHAEIFSQRHLRKGIISVLKHFPGHGSAWNDSHYGMADVTETWQPLELEPYRYMIETGQAPMIMSAHIFNEQWSTEHPATLVYEVMTTMLRDELGFEGVLVSDDMQMGAITEYYGLEQAVLLAVNAGMDMLIFANNSVYDPEISQKVIEIIKGYVASGDIKRERIEQAYERIQRLKAGF